jgi:septal ring factor EnvC (AmiA/AmiB activator)
MALEFGNLEFTLGKAEPASDSGELDKALFEVKEHIATLEHTIKVLEDRLETTLAELDRVKAQNKRLWKSRNDQQKGRACLMVRRLLLII